MATANDRFWAKVQLADPTDCWLWTGARGRTGYGQFNVRKADGTPTTAMAHRYAYETTMGPIPDGLVIDHLCRVRHCVNPHHLEPVTPRENILRGDTAKWERDKTHCPQGHPYSGDNLVRHHGSRECRMCKNTNQTRTRRARLALTRR